MSDTILCKMKNIFIPGTVLYASCFQTSIVIANLAKISYTLRKGVNLGTGCNKIIALCTLYTKNGIFYFSDRSNR